MITYRPQNCSVREIAGLLLVFFLTPHPQLLAADSAEDLLKQGSALLEKGQYRRSHRHVHQGPCHRWPERRAWVAADWPT